ncbi:hypothetical protein CXU10_09615 [Akkermansia muciniphila]|nr:hypothetical protein CXU10_09615 [Akkermansia muciniphila]
MTRSRPDVQAFQEVEKGKVSPRVDCVFSCRRSIVFPEDGPAGVEWAANTGGIRKKGIVFS